MRMYSMVLVPLLVLFGAVPVQAQTSPLVEVDVDYAAFAFDQEASLLEVYLAFGAASLPFDADEQGYRARLPLDIAVVRNTDAALEGTPVDPVWADSLSLDFVVSDTAALSQGQYFLHQTRVPIQPGEYELRLRVPGDQSRGRQELELRRDVLVPDYAQEENVGLSDITLASSIAPTQDRDDIFYKNGLSIRPNANQLYGQGVPQLFYYAEAYNATEVAGEDGTYTVLAYIAEANRPSPLPDLQKRTERPARTPDVLAGSFDLSKLPSGSYFMRLVVLDENNEAEAEQTRKFFVYNPSVEREAIAVPEMTFETSPYATMEEEEVERGLKHIQYIATEQEKRRSRSIQDLDEKRRFLMDFWQKRDPDLSTPINEYRDEIYSRIQYANDRFSNSFREGWESDRGRVLVKYGVPEQIEPHLFDRETVPYELWEYTNIPGAGQAVFVFADTGGFGDFELIHSTAPGERKTQDWQAELTRH